jgi:hypothetical protein
MPDEGVAVLLKDAQSETGRVKARCGHTVKGSIAKGKK